MNQNAKPAQNAQWRKASPMGLRSIEAFRQRLFERWLVEIKDPIQMARHWLGTYDTTDEVTLVYDRAVIHIKRDI